MTITDERWDFDVNRLAKVLAIDVPGSTAQRKLDLLKSIALLLLFASGMIATVLFCAALKGWTSPVAVAVEESTSQAAALSAGGFTPLASAVLFIAILLAGTLTLVAAPLMEPLKRKFAWAATFLAYMGTLAAFIHYGVRNEEAPFWSLVVNFGASTIITLGVLVLMTLATFKAK